MKDRQLFLKEIQPKLQEVARTSKLFGADLLLLFGSALWKSSPNDLDLIVRGLSTSKRLELRKEIETITGFPVDLLDYNHLSSPLFSFIGRFR